MTTQLQARRHQSSKFNALYIYFFYTPFGFSYVLFLGQSKRRDVAHSVKDPNDFQPTNMMLRH